MKRCTVNCPVNSSKTFWAYPNLLNWEKNSYLDILHFFSIKKLLLARKNRVIRVTESKQSFFGRGKWGWAVVFARNIRIAKLPSKACLPLGKACFGFNDVFQSALTSTGRGICSWLAPWLLPSRCRAPSGPRPLRSPCGEASRRICWHANLNVWRRFQTPPTRTRPFKAQR